jgi:PPOX class probable F420-dependent enzyme
MSSAAGAFGPLDGHQYMSVETIKRSGERVATPVWFAVYGGGLCFTTGADAGKVKRMRHTPRGRVAPCSSSGALLGDWIDVTFRLLSGGDEVAADSVLLEKYGLLYRLFAGWGRLRSQQRVYVGVTAAPPQQDASG